MKRYIKSSTRSDAWNILSPASQSAVERAVHYIDNGESIDDAIRYAVKDISEANYFDEYSGEDFYDTEPDEIAVRAYVEQYC